jgi:5'-nucleotidase
LNTTMAANTKGLAIAPLASTLASEATRLRAAGATIITTAAHAGGACRAFDNPLDLTSCATDEEIFTLARDLPSGLVDAIVAGHRHQGIAHEVAGIPIIASYWHGQAFGRVDLFVDRATCKVTGHRIFPTQAVCARQYVPGGGCVDDSDRQGEAARYEGRIVEPSREIAAIIASAAARVRSLKEKELNAEIERPLALSPGDESPLGNLVVDWMRASVPEADAAITNSGGLRAPLPAGRLTYGRLYELLPFDNREAILELNGAELRRIIEHNLQQRDSVLLVSGVRATAICQNRRLRVAIRRDSGALVRDEDELKVVTSDFLASGGDRFFAPIHRLRVVRSDGPLVREHIADWLTRSGGRWPADDLAGAHSRRIAFQGTRPVSCDS